MSIVILSPAYDRGGCYLCRSFEAHRKFQPTTTEKGSHGHYVLAFSFPRLDVLAERAEHEWFTYTGPHGHEVRVSGTTRYDHVRQIYHEDAIRRWRDASGQEISRLAPLARRCFFPQELEVLLHYDGFQTVHCHGDWDRSEMTDTSPVMIFVCQPRR